MNKFIESSKFPIADINEFSASEKSGRKPPFWEMVFWPTRKPLVGARSIIAGALLDENLYGIDFPKLVRLISSRTPHRDNPQLTPILKEMFSKIKLLDPFAGFGSIPLEAVRLSLGEVVAVEFLPIAYVFLKAVLEIPKWAVDKGISGKLIEDVENWGKWIVEELKKDPDIQELYDPDVVVYIGTWEVKCPYCNKYTPLIGNYWLARVKGKGEKYKKLVWMEPIVEGDRIEIKVKDFHKEFKQSEIKAKVSKNTVETSTVSYNVPEANVNAKISLARCLHLHCNRVMPGKGNHWYVKQALKEWNENFEKYLNGEVDLEKLRHCPARLRILIKVKKNKEKKELEFESATEKDDEKLWRALEKLRTIWVDPDIPIEPVPTYENRRITPILGADKWFQFFNPRQLLILSKLIKLIREAGKKIEEKKLREGERKEEAFKYAEAITTYLAIALIKHANYNSIVTSTEPTQKFIRESLAFRGIAMTWNWIEEKPFVDIIGSFTRSLNSILEGLAYLVSAVSGSHSKVRVLLDDATSLGNFSTGKFDLIVTDPPYKDDVPYAEVSDFYYVWLKRALSDVENGMLKPRFYPEVFFECIDERCRSFTEIRTQWEKFAPLEISVSFGRAEFFKRMIGVDAGSDRDFKEKLGKAFRRMTELIKDDGLIVTYYAHTDPSAWTALIEAGWRKAGLRVTSAYVMVTESEHRVTARGKVALDASVVVVWRKGSGGVALLPHVEREALEESSRRVEKAIKTRDITFDINLFLKALAGALSVFTSYSKLIPEVSTSEIIDKAFSLALKGLVEGFYRCAGLRKSLDPYASTYLVLKLVTRTSRKDAGSRKVEAKFSRGRVDRIFAVLIGTLGGIKVNDLITSRILTKSGKELELLEPEAERLEESAIRRALEVLLHEKGLDLSKPETFKTSIDALHYLELKALQLTSEHFRKLYEVMESNPKISPKVLEAIELAKVLYLVLPDSDPEKICCRRILSHLNLLQLVV
jgi:putative DNA methylase